MIEKKYLSYDGLTEYDDPIKHEIAKNDEVTLTTAKEYVNTVISELITVDDIDVICGGSV